MRKTVFLFLILSVLFTGCIEIVEEISVNKNKSGSVIYRIETNEAGFFLNNLSGLFDISVEDQVRKEAQKFINKLQSQPGISNISYNLNSRSGDYYLQFDFSDHKQFNNAIYAMSGNKKTMFTPSYFKISKNRFKKINFSPWLKRYMEKEEIEFPSPMMTEMITYTSVINLPKTIKKAKPSSVKISDTQAIQKISFSEIIDGKANTGMRIKY